MQDPILRDFPQSFVTERLVVRAPRPGDGPDLNAAILESLDELRPWMPWAHTVPSIEDSEANVRRAYVKFIERSDLRYSLYLKSGEFVGSSGLHRIDWDVPMFEIGYWVRTSHAGRGLIREAVNGIAAFALETLKARRLEIRCDATNERSARVAERCGFQLEARLKNDSVSVSGELRDTLIYVRFPES